MNIVKNLFKGTTTNNLDKEIQQKDLKSVNVQKFVNHVLVNSLNI